MGNKVANPSSKSSVDKEISPNFTKITSNEIVLVKKDPNDPVYNGNYALILEKKIN